MRRWSSLLLVAAVAAFGMGTMGAAEAVQKAPAIVDAPLATALRAAAPTDEIMIFLRGTNLAAAESALQKAGLRQITTWDAIAVAVGVGTPAQVRAAIRQPNVVFVEADGPAYYDLNTAHAATRGDEARTLSQLEQPLGGPYDGAGVTIAINDSGVDGGADMFQGPGGSKVKFNVRELCHEAVVSGCTVNVENSDIGNGHGTHVAGIAAGYQKTTANGRLVRGAAPGATLVAHGSGVGLSIFAGNGGLNWALQRHADPCGNGSCPPIKVVNNSWGSGGAFNPNSANALLTNALVAQGVVVVYSAGNGDTTNNGGDGSSNLVRSQAMNPTPGVIGVANYDDAGLGTRDGALNSSSSRGLKTDNRTWPDLAAPGTLIVSACTYALPICRSNGDVLDPNYAEISGTSMAAPYVAGVVALLFQANPSLTPAQVEDILEDNAYQFGDPASYQADDPSRNNDHLSSFDKGHGLVDVVAALGEARNVSVPVGPSCANTGNGGVVFDSADDATDFVVPTGAPAQASAPGLDIVSGGISKDSVTGDLTFFMTVVDLTGFAPPGATGENIRFIFTYRGTQYLATAARTPAGVMNVQQTGSLTVNVLNGTTVASGLATTFDVNTDTISITVPNEAWNTWNPAIPIAGPGDVLTGYQQLAQRRIGPGPSITPTADSAAAGCPFVIPA